MKVSCLIAPPLPTHTPHFWIAYNLETKTEMPASFRPIEMSTRVFHRTEICRQNICFIFMQLLLLLFEWSCTAVCATRCQSNRRYANCEGTSASVVTVVTAAVVAVSSSTRLAVPPSTCSQSQFLFMAFALCAHHFPFKLVFILHIERRVDCQLPH